MFSIKKCAHPTLRFVALAAVAGLLFATSASVRAHSKKYDKCQARCVQRAGVCLEDAAEVGDDSKRARKKTECEHRQQECSAKCEE